MGVPVGRQDFSTSSLLVQHVHVHMRRSGHCIQGVSYCKWGFSVHTYIRMYQRVQCTYVCTYICTYIHMYVHMYCDGP